MKRRVAMSLLAALTLYGATAKIDDGKRWWSHIAFLADDKLEGRETGSPGHRKAADYIAAQFERAGLKPAGESGYIQPVKLRSRQIVEAQSNVTLIRDGKRTPVALGEEAILGVRTEPPEHVSAPMVFVGYGLVVPENNYNDLAGLDLRGKIAVYLSGGPSSIPGPLKSHYQSAPERNKQWQSAGVVGLIAFTNPKSMDVPWTRISASRLQPAMALADDASPPRLSVSVNPAHADKFLAGSGHSFAELLALADAGKPLPTFPIPASLEAHVEIAKKDIDSQNVIAVLPGADRNLRHEYVALSGHFDHLGIGALINGDSIYNGAMDNASGIASILEIAAALKGSKLKRSILFATMTGEEKGLLGSQYFTAHPTVKAEDIVADLNLDMFLPLFPLRIVTAVGAQESDLGDRLRSVAAPLGITVQIDPEPQRNLFIRSDQYNFIRRGIPALAFKVGYTAGSPEEAIAKKWLMERYHAPSDDLSQPVDLKAAAEFNDLLRRLAEEIANNPERPRWKPDSFFRRFAQ